MTTKNINDIYENWRFVLIFTGEHHEQLLKSLSFLRVCQYCHIKTLARPHLPHSDYFCKKNRTGLNLITVGLLKKLPEQKDRPF